MIIIQFLIFFFFSFLHGLLAVFQGLNRGLERERRGDHSYGSCNVASILFQLTEMFQLCEKLAFSLGCNGGVNRVEVISIIFLRGKGQDSEQCGVMSYSCCFFSFTIIICVCVCSFKFFFNSIQNYQFSWSFSSAVLRECKWVSFTVNSACCCLN